MDQKEDETKTEVTGQNETQIKVEIVQEINEEAESNLQIEKNAEFQPTTSSQKNKEEAIDFSKLPKDLGLIASGKLTSDEPRAPKETNGESIPNDQTHPRDNPKRKLTIKDLEKYETIETKDFGAPPSAEMNLKEMKVWEYLVDQEFREYQFYIVETCLFYNTLVSLPTGLGKTFIAVNVMLNFYRWFQNGQIFFLAPSKALVAQQMTACMESEAFEMNDLVELTGETHSENRKCSYEKGRVFFMTPQALEYDIDCDRIDLEKVVLVVYGNHSGFLSKVLKL